MFSAPSDVVQRAKYQCKSVYIFFFWGGDLKCTRQSFTKSATSQFDMISFVGRAKIKIENIIVDLKVFRRKKRRKKNGFKNTKILDYCRNIRFNGSVIQNARNRKLIYFKGFKLKSFCTQDINTIIRV